MGSSSIPAVLPSEVSCYLPRNDWKGLCGVAWPGNQDVEEVPHGSHGLVLGGTVSGALENVGTGRAGSKA